MASLSERKGLIFWPVAAVIVLADLLTKSIASTALYPPYPRPVFGDVVRLTLVYNPGAAFGLNLGPYSRWIFLGLTLGALVILARLYMHTLPHHVLRVLAIAMVCGGAVGNLVDRVRSAMGVVDFIDVGVGDMRWPTFNVADMAVSIGAVLLAWVLWGEERTSHSAQAAPVQAETQRTT